MRTLLTHLRRIALAALALALSFVAYAIAGTSVLRVPLGAIPGSALADTLPTPPACPANAPLTWDGAAWTCRAARTSCAAGEASRWTGTAWTCLALPAQLSATIGATAAAPGLARPLDPDTGLFSDTADTLSIATGGVERLRIAGTTVRIPTQNVWAGTDTGSSNGFIAHGTAGGFLQAKFGTNFGARLTATNTSTGALQTFGTSWTTSLQFTASNVVIPTNLLVSGGAGITSSCTDCVVASIGHQSGATPVGRIHVGVTDGTVSPFVDFINGSAVRANLFWQNSSGTFQINSYNTPTAINAGGGNVAIGKTAARDLLDVNGRGLFGYWDGLTPVDLGARTLLLGRRGPGDGFSTLGMQIPGHSWAFDLRPAGALVLVHSTASAGGFADRLTLQTTGAMTIAGALTQNSDARLKTNIAAIGPAWRGLLALPPVRYDRIDNGERNQLGFLAQDVRRVFPSLVGETDGHLTLNYLGLVAPVVAGLQDHEARLARLEADLATLRAENERLRVRAMGARHTAHP